jgi:hypothetical protein
MVELPISEKGLKKVLYVGKGAPMSVVKLPVEEFEQLYEREKIAIQENCGVNT